MHQPSPQRENLQCWGGRGVERGWHLAQWVRDVARLLRQDGHRWRVPHVILSTHTADIDITVA